MTNPTPDIPMLDDEAIAEIEAMFPHAEYQPTLSPDEVDSCEFCKGAIDDHKANCVVPHVFALCATVRALPYQLDQVEKAFELEGALKLSEVGDLNALQIIKKMISLQSQLEQAATARDQLSAGLSVVNAQLEQVTKERDELRQRLQGERAMDLLTERTLKPEIDEAIKNAMEKLK